MLSNACNAGANQIARSFAFLYKNELVHFPFCEHYVATTESEEHSFNFTLRSRFHPHTNPFKTGRVPQPVDLRFVRMPAEETPRHCLVAQLQDRGGEHISRRRRLDANWHDSPCALDLHPGTTANSTGE